MTNVSKPFATAIDSLILASAQPTGLGLGGTNNTGCQPDAGR